MEGMRGWWVAGTISVILAWILCCVVQAVAGDALPPDISVSQYGVGPHGWVFSVWMLTVAAGPAVLYAYRPVRGWGARWWIGVGVLGTAVMATVRTDPGGLQESVNAKIHMIGAVLALAGLPIGILCALMVAARAWRRGAMVLVAISASSLELLLISAAGVDTTGAGAVTSWSLWQSVALAADMLLLVALAFGTRTIPPLAGDPEPWWTGQRGGVVRVREPAIDKEHH
jgi:hypothetical protein